MKVVVVFGNSDESSKIADLIQGVPLRHLVDLCGVDTGNTYKLSLEDRAGLISRDIPWGRINHLTIVYQDSVSALLKNIEAFSDIESAIRQQRENLETLLTLRQISRRKVSLLPEGWILQNAEKASIYLEDKGLNNDLASLRVLSKAEDKKSFLFADYLVRSTLPLSELQTEVAVNSEYQVEQNLDAQQVIEIVRQDRENERALVDKVQSAQQEQAETYKELMQLQELLTQEKKEFKEQISSLQSQVNEKKSKITALENKLDKLTTERDNYREQSKAEELKLLKEENSLVLRELFRLQEKLAEYYEAGLIDGSKIRQMQLQLSKYKASDYELSNIKARFSYRATHLLRLIGARVLPFLKRRVEEERVIKAIIHSGEFDEKWYVSRYPDVKNSTLEPVVHYVRHGVEEGRDPNQSFSTSNYLNRYKDVSKSGVNPLFHFVRFGRDEGRTPN